MTGRKEIQASIISPDGMEWRRDELIVQQLDRKQQESRLIYCNSNDGSSRTFWAENDDAWVDLEY